VDGFRVDYNGVERSLATRLHLPEGEVVLRSADNCLPVWRNTEARRDPERVIPTR
jgi:hypothetical protein